MTRTPNPQSRKLKEEVENPYTFDKDHFSQQSSYEEPKIERRQ
jgi:hypothetical protein